MADITNVFKALIKTVKSKSKSISGAKDVDNSILPPVKQRSDFEARSRRLVSSITQLRTFLVEHRKEYVSAGSLLSMEASSMTDAERDQIETEAETIIKQCQETIIYIRNTAETQIVHPQIKEHRFWVLKLLEEYLKVVCKIYTEQKAVRVKRVVDRKRISKLEPEKSYKQRKMNSLSLSKSASSNLNQSSTESSKKQSSARVKSDESNDSVTLRQSSAVAQLDEDKRRQEEEEDISPEEAQMFEKENQAIFEEMNSMVSEISQIEGKVIEVAKLQEIFTEKVLEQEIDIDRIEQSVVGTTENIKDANEEIREAMKNSAGFRVWILFFILVCTLSILFLDWYNS